MRPLFTCLLVLASLAPLSALAESETPAPAPEATPTPAPVATPAPVQTPAPTPVTTPSWTAAGELAAPAASRPARPVKGWDVEAAVASQGVFDGGIHVFSEDSWLTGAELRVRKAVAPGFSRVSAAPELSYGLAHESRLYPGSASTELYLQRFQAGVRASVFLDRFPSIHPVGRAGATGLWGTALAHGTYRDHREEAYGFGAYASAGFEVDLGRAFTLLDPEQRLLFGVEAGHLYTGGLGFGRMGMLDVNGAFMSAQLTARF
jgi:hypothetical protein